MRTRMISRREFLRRVEGSLVCSLAGGALMPLNSMAAPAQPLDIGTSPQLFLDDYAIDKCTGLRREVRSPQRHGKPVLDSKTFGVTQSFLTVLRDGDKNRYRAWHNNGDALCHAESEDAIHWGNPRVLKKFGNLCGAGVIDDTGRASDPKRRFKMGAWQLTRALADGKGDNGGTFVSFSPDGLQWTDYEKNPVLPTWPEGYGNGNFVRHSVGDIVDVFYDPLRKHYGAAVKLPALPEDGYAPGPRSARMFRRLVGMSTSMDFMHWEKPWRIFTPDEKDDGLLEFYSMGGVHTRGSLYIGMLRVLRDDLSCDPGGPKNGIGYTVLATSRDGVTWHRYREPFLDRNSDAGSWDHAMTWIGSTLPMGDEVYLYYGGFARGHKIEIKTERQIGLARMKKDRYVALTPEQEQGTLLTRPFLYPGGKLTLNADAARGAVRVRLLDQDGQPMKAFGEGESKPITTDALAAEVQWTQSPRTLKGKPVRFEFKVRNAALFGFEFHPTRG